MFPSDSAFALRISKAVPDCLSGLTLSEPQVTGSDGEGFKVYREIECPCGSDWLALVGYPLSSLVPKRQGPELFVSPLKLRCASCGKTREIPDTRIHGYHSELNRAENGAGDTTHVCGSGAGNEFECPNCRATSFAVGVNLFYMPAVHDLGQDESGIPLQNFFTDFLLLGECSRCSEVTQMTGFDQL